MINIPNGTVTFLFTDIEGSTRLAQEFPESLPAALEKHHAIMHKATESNNGFVYEIVGDAFCCAFEKSEDAVTAAVDAQLNLGKEKWDDAVIKIRIGIHSGNAEWNGKRYMGYITLAITARVMSSAYGEQIIISNDTFKLAKDVLSVPNQEIGNEGVKLFREKFDLKDSMSQSDLSEDLNSLSLTPRSQSPDWERRYNEISFRDLGERRLKDLKQPVRLFQILSEGLRSEFPPIKTLDARPNNLPVQLTNFIGREDEIKHVKELFKDTHLMTLTGSGGSGKTRFALQTGADIIDDFANGVWFVELAAVSDPVFLPITIINSLGLKEEPKKTLEETLTGYLKDKELLIILDNCEHLIEACAEMTERLLIKCPKLKIIATSREALNCKGEQTYRIPPLTQPDPNQNDTPEQLTQYESVRLFIERALSVNSKFRVNNENAPALAAICSHLDGIPLAIELAAAKIKVLSVEKIYERLDDRFNLLTGGKRTALPRQQTLRALIDWSYDLLSEEEKTLWSRISVFKGGWTLEAAEEVCSDEKIKKEEVLELSNQLTEKSIIIFERDKERYRILDTLKVYGDEKLNDSGEEEDTIAKHLHFFMRLSLAAEPELEGNEIQIWLEKLESDHGNFQAAISRSLLGKEKEKGARLAGALGNFWFIRGHYSTGRRILDSILNEKVSKHALAKAFYHNGMLTRNSGQYELAAKFLDESLILSREMGQKRGIAISLNGLGFLASAQGNYDQAKKFYQESLELFREIGDKRGIANSLDGFGSVASHQGKYKQAQNFYLETLALFRDMRDKRGTAMSLYGLGYLAYEQGNYEQAQTFYEENLAIRRELGDKRGCANSLHGFGCLAIKLRNFEHAQKLFEESIELSREIGEKRGIAFSLFSLGDVAYRQNNHKLAQKFYEESLLMFRELKDKRSVAFSLDGLGNVANQLGNHEQAQNFYAESFELFKGIRDNRGLAFTLIEIAGLLIESGKHLHRAVLMIGASETLIEVKGEQVLINFQQELKEKLINKLHEKLSDEEFSEYFEQGKMITPEQAAELALSGFE